MTESYLIFIMHHYTMQLKELLVYLRKDFQSSKATLPAYSAKTQSQIVLACCILHNYLKVVDRDEELIAESNQEKTQKWKIKPLSNYDKLEELWAKDLATEEGAEIAKEKLKRWNDFSEKEVTIGDIDNLVSQNRVSLDNYYDLEVETNGPSNSPYEKKPSRKRPCAKKRRKVSVKEEDLFKDMFTNVVNAIQSGNEMLDNAIVKSSQPRGHAPEEICNELKSLEFEAYFLDDAYEWLVDNEKKGDVEISEYDRPIMGKCFSSHGSAYEFYNLYALSKENSLNSSNPKVFEGKLRPSTSTRANNSDMETDNDDESCWA
ncbi:hypothetical protein AKJ16_DCAP01067 [Drosera capensis]